MQTYVVASQRNLQVARNRQFAECMKQGRPFITVGNKRRFSSVELDMFTTSSNLDEATQYEMTALLQARSEPDAWITGSSLICRTSKIKADIAEAVARELYALAERAMQRREPVLAA